MGIKIGVTERGDPSRDWSWFGRLDSVDGAIIITKRITNFVGKHILRAHKAKKPIMLHAGCTGWGETWLEPNVPDFKIQLDSIQHLLNAGFPRDNIVLRIDPIIPTEEGLTRIRDVIDTAIQKGILPGMRVRISILDEYRHVKTRFATLGQPEIFPGRFTANQQEIERLTQTLRPYYDRYQIQFECCAENGLIDPIYTHVGCVSEKDLETMGLQPDTTLRNMQNRNGCKCLANKCDLLTEKKRCPNACAYCYWRN